VVDTGSRNGVLINGRPLKVRERAALHDGDTLSLGAVELAFSRDEAGRVVLDDEEDEPTAATMSRPDDLKQLLRDSAEMDTPAERGTSVERVERVMELVTSIGQRLTGVLELEEILEAIVDLVQASTPAERAVLLLWEDKAERLVPKVVRGEGERGQGELRVSRSVVERAFEERCTVQVAPGGDSSDSIARLGIRSAAAVPLWNQDRVIGVIYADTHVHTGAFDPFEVALLATLANYAAIAIEQNRLLLRIRQEERAKERLGRYHSRAVVERILAGGDQSGEFSLGPQEADVTVLFCDMVDFTSTAESLTPQAVMLLLNEYFSRMTEVIFELDGTLDKYIGDAIMAVFGAPLPQADHARRAARAALGFRDVVLGLNERRTDQGLNFRIGMSSGRAVAGDLGHAQRREWTVLGSTVNLASRLESSVAQPGQIVLSGATRAALGDEFLVRRIEFQQPKGITRDIEVWELLDLRS
jgi:adenylate cyclase